MRLLLVLVIWVTCFAGINFTMMDKSIVVPDFKNRYEATLWGMSHKGDQSYINATLDKITALTKEYDSYPKGDVRKVELTELIGYNAKAIEVMSRPTPGAIVHIGIKTISTRKATAEEIEKWEYSNK
jgi:hypothetical protein